MPNTYLSPEGNPGTGNLSATLTSVYTAPASTTTVVKSLYITNIHATNIGTIDICIRKSGRAYDIYIAKAVSIAVGVTYNAIEGGPIVLQTGDALRLKASAASTLDSYISLMEIT